MKRKILITGAAGNLGRVITKYFLEKGFQVVALVGPEDSTDFIQDKGLMIFQTDLSDEKGVMELFKKIKIKYMDIDAAIFLVGGFAMGDLLKTSSADVLDMINLNFVTAYNTSRSFIKSFSVEQGEMKRIVLVGARPALDPRAGQDAVAYSLSKTLIFKLSELINAAADSVNVWSSVIVPSIIDTEANRMAMPDANYDDWVKPIAIADAIGFLLSDAGKSAREAVIKMYNNA